MSREVIPRERWNAGPEVARQIEVKKDIMFVHHSVTAAPSWKAKAQMLAVRGLSKTGIRAAERAAVKLLQTIARSRGFVDISYSFVAFQSGRLYEGRGKGREGAHTQGYNDRYAVVAVGNYDSMRPTDRLVNSVKWLRTEHLGCRRAKGHRDVNPTGCPGNHLYNRLEDM